MMFKQDLELELCFLTPQDALEVIGVSHSLSESLSHSWLADLTDVTLVSDDTFCKLY